MRVEIGLVALELLLVDQWRALSRAVGPMGSRLHCLGAPSVPSGMISGIKRKEIYIYLMVTDADQITE